MKDRLLGYLAAKAIPLLRSRGYVVWEQQRRPKTGETITYIAGGLLGKPSSFYTETATVIEWEESVVFDHWKNRGYVRAQRTDDGHLIVDTIVYARDIISIEGVSDGQRLDSKPKRGGSTPSTPAMEKAA